MIPRDFVTEWRQSAPWPLDSQVELDLMICRSLVETFAQPGVGRTVAFRGGTALYKLYVTPPLRFSEDIDLVQVEAGPIGPTLDALRSALDPWLGTPRRSLGEGGVTLSYRTSSEGPPSVPLRLKLEVNTREQFSADTTVERRLDVRSRWFAGSAGIRTYTLDELLGTKLRALYQRKKGRDLFDLWASLRRPDVDPARVVEAFTRYLSGAGLRVSRAEFEENLAEKLTDSRFASDVPPLLAPGTPWDLPAAAADVRARLLSLLPGAPWKGTDKVPAHG